MPYHYLGDIATADTAFEATGTTLEEVFKAAADALLNTMTEDVATLGRTEEVSFEVETPELDILLFSVLNELVYLKDARQLLLRITSVSFIHGEETHKAQVVAHGERIDYGRHRLLVDVKAVTLHRFFLKQDEQGWKTQVVLDV